MTIEGVSLEGTVGVTRKGVEKTVLFPRDAKPDCVSCDKPDLLPSNFQVVNCFDLIANKQERSHFGGEYLGLAFETVVRAIEWGEEAGFVTDPDLVMRRIWILDGIVCRIRNAKIEQSRSQK